MKSSKTLKCVITSCCLALGACASVNSVSLTPIPSQRGKTVRASVSKTVILGLTFDNDFINPLVDDLKRQCPNGMVSGILTKDETIHYLFVYTHRVTASGYCNAGLAKNQAAPTRSKASED